MVENKKEGSAAVNEAIGATLAQIEQSFVDVAPAVDKRTGPGGESEPMTLAEALSVLKGITWEKPFDHEDTVWGDTGEEGDTWRGMYHPLSGFQISNVGRQPSSELTYAYYSIPDKEAGWPGFLELITDNHIIKFRPAGTLPSSG